MYIIELFFKIKDNIILQKNRKTNTTEEKEQEKCSHTFFPIDSTKRILACSKCGEIYKLKKGEKNPFSVD